MSLDLPQYTNFSKVYSLHLEQWVKLIVLLTVVKSR